MGAGWMNRENPERLELANGKGCGRYSAMARAAQLHNGHFS